jgi:hypothetical protein
LPATGRATTATNAFVFETLPTNVPSTGFAGAFALSAESPPPQPASSAAASKTPTPVHRGMRDLSIDMWRSFT